MLSVKYSYLTVRTTGRTNLHHTIQHVQFNAAVRLFEISFVCVFVCLSATSIPLVQVRETNFLHKNCPDGRDLWWDSNNSCQQIASALWFQMQRLVWDDSKFQYGYSTCSSYGKYSGWCCQIKLTVFQLYHSIAPGWRWGFSNAVFKHQYADCMLVRYLAFVQKWFQALQQWLFPPSMTA